MAQNQQSNRTQEVFGENAVEQRNFPAVKKAVEPAGARAITKALSCDCGTDEDIRAVRTRR
ncbi:MAG TPA: hypothetical protein VMW23_09250 [Sedimentisphaerales bacterium]|nr:hypothetical protein [Sedimentisphaerales bacterium]